MSSRHALGGSGDHGLSRRAVLRGLGTAVALPWLESLRRPIPVRAAPASAIPTRMAFLYIPNGVHLPRWRPLGEGRDYRLGPTLEPLAEFKDDMQIISGLAHRTGTAGTDGAGDHARASASFLTGVRPRKTAGADIRAGISVDQVAANVIGEQTRFASLELSCDASRQSGPCDSGYSCAYQFNMAWKSERQPIAPESNPRLVFERLFGAGKGAERAASLAARRAAHTSILDFVMTDAATLQGRLAAADRHKLDEYLTGLRDIERQVARFDDAVPDVPDHDLPDRPPPAYSEHVRLLADMLVLAFQTDSTRIATFMFARDGSNRSFPEIGIGDGHHNLSHHQGNEEKLEKIAAIDRFHAEQFAYFLGKLRGVREADGRSLLDHTMLVYAGGLSDGDRHRHDDLPVILAGRAGGRLAAGRHVRLPGEQPMTNLYLSMLALAGAPQPSFGDSTGPLDAIRV
jgi:hypothetical protein